MHEGLVLPIQLQALQQPASQYIAMQVHMMRPLGLQSATAPLMQRCMVRPFSAGRGQVVVRAELERLRLNNLSPWKGSRDLERRKGRGHAAGQGSTCGFGNRGQKSRSGSGVRTGFEGGQTPLYRRLPKLKGIAGGMGAGLPDFVTVNLYDLEKHFSANEEVTLASVKAKVKSVSGGDTHLPLKILGSGELTKPLNIKAASFSKSASEKIAAAGGKTEALAGPKKWSKKIFKKTVKAMAEQGLDYKTEAAKKRTAKAIKNGQISTKRKAKASRPAKIKPGRVVSKSS